MKRLLPLLLIASLAGCGEASETQPETAADSDSPKSKLERAAIDAGIIPDTRTMTLAGAFERQSDLGEDRFCAVGNDERGYQVGVLAVFGPDSKCEGQGMANRNGETIDIVLDSEQRCEFSASFDGVELKFPGSLPEACASYCTPRANLGGVGFFLVGEGDAVARSTRGREITDLCPGS